MLAVPPWLGAAQGVVHDPALARPIAAAARRRVWSDVEAFGLRRDLQVTHADPQAKIQIGVRPLEPRDVPAVLDDGVELPPDEKWDRAMRREMLDAGIGRPYVAVTDQDEACYTQWLFDAADNVALRRHFAGIFPELREDTALLEGAFTPTAWRGRGVMSAAMSRIASRGADLGARYVITFVGTENAPSLKGCRRAGFEPYVLRTQRFRLGRQAVSFDEGALTSD